jgi:putative PIN family toxin of toxin-antitoxin system
VRIVFDTNVLLAGLFTRGVCEALLDACVGSEQHVIILSEHVLDEFARHAKEKLGAPQDKVEHALAVLRGNCEVAEPSDIPADACRDANDLPVLGTALAGKADCIVSGDQDLLLLRTFRSARILSPRQLYNHLIST